MGRYATYDHRVINHLYDHIARSPLSLDALLCVLLEFRIGGILEGMQLNAITPDTMIPSAGGYHVSFVRPSDGRQFSINTTNALVLWRSEDSEDSEDSESLEWHAQFNIDELCYDLQESLARLVTSMPPRDKKRLTHERD
jgi:hypothetical protein